jgi:hypothetical protein
MKYTVAEFATHLRSLFPGQESTLTDQELVDQWLQKHPEDREKIISEEKKSKPPKVVSVVANVFDKTWTSLVLIAVVWTILSVNDVPIVTDINQWVLSSFDNKEDIEEGIDLVFDPNLQENSSVPKKKIINDITIDQNIRNKVDTNVIVSYLKLDDQTKNTIMQILSDPNPDPLFNNGEYCGDIISHCKYCSRQIPHPKYFRTIQESLRVRLFSENTNLLVSKLVMAQSRHQESQDSMNDSKIDWGGLMYEALLGDVKGWDLEIIEFCNVFKSGTKYTCEFFDRNNPTVMGMFNRGKLKEFCSIKCQDDYKYR